MFTGLIKSIGVIEAIDTNGTNTTMIIAHDLDNELSVDESIAHDGVCLTVERIIDQHRYQVTAIEETMLKTQLSEKSVGDKLNLERALPINSRLGGHIVQGHIDTTATCIDKLDRDGSYIFRFRMEPQYAALIIEKGSITINGVSLTLFDITVQEFSVAIIPYTYAHTTFHLLEKGNNVNIEFDILGKYILRKGTIENSF